MKQFVILLTLLFFNGLTYAQISITGLSYVCPGSTHNYTATLSGDTGGIGMGTYIWTLNDNFIGNGFSIDVTIPSGASAHVLTVSYVERGNPDAGESATMYLYNPYPGVVRLRSSATICYGESASVSVGLQRVGPGGDGTFQKRTGGVWQDVHIPGASITVPNLTSDTDFRFKITNSCGPPQYSNFVSVTVINPPLPVAPSINKKCNETILTKGTAPSGFTYYWQGTNSNGTSTTSVSNSNTYTVTTSGTYYIRAKSNIVSDCWGPSRAISVTVVKPSLPVAPSKSQQCNQTILTKGSAPTGFTYYWQGTNSNGTSTTSVSSSNTYTATNSGTYYIRSKSNLVANCWGPSRSISVTVAKPLIPPVPSENKQCGKSILTRSSAPFGYTYYWQGTNPNGTSTGNKSTNYTVTNSGTYYIRSKSNVVSNCWGPSRSISVSLNTSPDISAGSNLSNYQFENSINLSGTGESPQGGNYSGLFVSNNIFNIPQNRTGNYTVTYTYTNANVCSASDTKTITVRENPEIIVNGTNDIVWGESRTLSVPGEFASYQWYRNGEPISGATSNVYEAKSIGKYEVNITAHSNASMMVSPQYIINKASQQNENLVQTINYKVKASDEQGMKNIGEVNEQVKYYDGLGRKFQTVLTQASPSRRDLVSPVEYDELGRPNKKFLPYAAEKDDGLVDHSALRGTGEEYVQSNQYAFYADNSSGQIATTTVPYSETIYEKSPLNRPVAQYAPGEDWAREAGAKAIATDYLINSVNDHVIRFTVNGNSLQIEGEYGSGDFQKTVVTDENGHQSVTFTDAFDKTKLKRNMADGQEFDTYYVYDIYDNLRFVIPPEAAHQLSTNSGQFPTDLLDNFVFQYRYDGRDRMEWKKVPGTEPVTMIYDDRDRLVLTQDGEQAKDNLFSFTKYDALNRPILTGEKVINNSIPNLRDLLSGDDWLQNYDAYETMGGSKYGYTSNSLPKNLELEEIHTVTYYDDYDFFHASQSEFHFVADELNDAYNAYVKGQVTGNMTKVLGTNSQWLRSINYYDDKYRLIQAVTENHKGGVDRVSNQYDFVGNVLKTKTNQFKPKPISIRNQYNVAPYADSFKSTATSTGWNSRFSTVNMLAAGQDGWFETRIDELTSKKFIGLTENDVTDHNDQLFRIYLKQGDLRVFTASGTSLLLGQLQIGDIIRIQRVGGIVSVLQNNIKVHSFNHTNNQRLFIDVSMNQGATVAGFKTNFNIPESSNEEDKDILWTAVENINISEDGSTITKQGADSWSNNNASSLNALKGGEDGVLSFEAGQADKELVVGLTKKDTGTGYGGILYGLNLKSNGDLAVRENGNYHGGLGAYMPGDKFEVIRMNGTIYYYKNGGLLYQSTIPYNDRLIVDVSLKTPEAVVENMKVSFSAPEFNSVDITITENFTYDHVDRLMEVTHQLAEPVKWEGLVGYEMDENNNLIHTAADHYNNTTANTTDVILENSNGFIEVQPESYSRMLFGLNDNPSGTSYADMDFCMYTSRNENLYVYENGSNKKNMGHYDIGDILRVEIRNGKVYYTKNGEVLYTSTKQVSSDFYGDVTSYYTGNTITNALFSTSGRQLMVSNQYNELGELINKKLHEDGDNFAQSVDYRYNIRGWLNRINHADLSADNANEKTDLFGMELGYTDNFGLNAQAQFNGNIAAVKWGGKINDLEAENVVQQNAYSYGYDGLNRITEADFYESASQNPGQKYQLRINEYDQNGNIKWLQRRNKTGGLLDDLTYNYTNSGNQLNFVNDAGDTNEGFIDGNTSGNDYAYDDNGNMISDANKKITSISYNNLNLPEEVNFENGNKIIYIYDAAGIKHRQEVYENNTLIKATDYIGSLIIENDTLQFIQTAEGRVVPKNVDGLDKNEYQYHLKDHLGNVRTTFAVRDDDYQTDYETGTNPYFDNYDQITILNNPLKRSGNYAHRLTGGGTDIVGLMKSLYVSKGDKVSAEVYGKYLDAQFTDEGINGAALINALVSTLGGGTLSGEGAAVQNNLNTDFLSAALADGSEEESPKAYLNYILLDKNFNYLNSGFERLTSSASDPGDGSGTHQKLSFEEIAIEEDGYLMVFVSNESEQSVEVFWDDFRVDHHYNAVLQADDYYPFGLTFNSYQRSYSKANNYKYNGKEEQEETGWYDYGARMYMPDLGRWNGVDELASNYYSLSPFNYVANNPIKFIDPDGRKIRFGDNVSLSFKVKVVGQLVNSFLKSRTARKNISQLVFSKKTHTINNGEGRLSGNETVPVKAYQHALNRPTTNSEGKGLLDMNPAEYSDYKKSLKEYDSNTPKDHKNGTGDDSEIYIDLDKAAKKSDENDDTTVGIIIDHEMSHAAAIDEGRVTNGSATKEENRAMKETNQIRREKNRFRLRKKIEQRESYD